MIYEWNHSNKILSVQKCIQGLTAYAVNTAVNGQDDKSSWLRILIEDMADFWGLETPNQYLSEFE